MVSSVTNSGVPKKRPGLKPGQRHAGTFGSPERGLTNRADPQLAAAARWSKDRREVAALAREARPEAFATIYDIMLDPKVEAPTRVRCGELILAYADGKPRQSVDVSVNGPRSTATIPTHELEAMLISGQTPLLLEHNGVVIDAERVNDVATSVTPAVTEGESVPQSVRVKKRRAK